METGVITKSKCLLKNRYCDNINQELMSDSFLHHKIQLVIMKNRFQDIT